MRATLCGTLRLHKRSSPPAPGPPALTGGAVCAGSRDLSSRLRWTQQARTTHIADKLRGRWQHLRVGEWDQCGQNRAINYKRRRPVGGFGGCARVGRNTKLLPHRPSALFVQVASVFCKFSFSHIILANACHPSLILSPIFIFHDECWRCAIVESPLFLRRGCRVSAPAPRAPEPAQAAKARRRLRQPRPCASTCSPTCLGAT